MNFQELARRLMEIGSETDRDEAPKYLGRPPVNKGTGRGSGRSRRREVARVCSSKKATSSIANKECTSLESWCVLGVCLVKELQLATATLSSAPCSYFDRFERVNSHFTKHNYHLRIHDQSCIVVECSLLTQHRNCNRRPCVRTSSESPCSFLHDLRHVRSLLPIKIRKP
jgi:hypothetical protein